MDIIGFIRIICVIIAFFLFYKSYYFWKLTIPERKENFEPAKIVIPDVFKKDLQFLITAPRTVSFDSNTVSKIVEKFKLIYDEKSGQFFKILNNHFLYRLTNNENPYRFPKNLDDFQTNSFALTMSFPFGTDNLIAYDTFVYDLKEMAALCEGEVRDKNQMLVLNYQRYRQVIYDYNTNFLNFLANSQI